MFILANLLDTIGMILDSLIWLLNILIIASVVMSWVSADPRNPLVQFVKNTTEPVFQKVRRYVPAIGMFDLSPLIVLLILQLISGVIVKSMFECANRLRDTPLPNVL